MGKILDSTNIKDSRYLFSQTPSDFQNDNYYLKIYVTITINK